VRPDFLVRAGNGRWVVDAKYKDDWSWKKDEHSSDVYQVVSYCSHKGVLRELGQGSDPDERPTAVILYPASSEDPVSDQSRGLELQASPGGNNVLSDFDVDVLRIPVRMPYAEASSPWRVPGDASAPAPVAKRDQLHIEREDGITLFTAFGRFAAG